MNIRKILLAAIACAVPFAAHGQAYVPPGSPITIGGTLPAFAATPTFNIGTAPTFTVGGPVAPGATQTGQPVPMGGLDGGGLARHIQTDTAGRVVLGQSGLTVGYVQLIASSAVGGIPQASRIPSAAAGNNVTVAKASVGRVYKIYACNTVTSARFIKLYNTATAPTVGTTAVVVSRVLPPAATTGVPLCQSFEWADMGFSFSTGISYALTTGTGLDADTGALAAGDVIQISVEFQ